MYGVDLLIDVLVLKTLQGKQLKTVEIFDFISRQYGISYPNTTSYESTVRLRGNGFTEEVKTNARGKTYQLTTKGKKTIEQILEVLS